MTTASLNDPMVVYISVNSDVKNIKLRVADNSPSIPLQLSTAVIAGRQADTYDGDYVVTPARDTEYVLDTDGLLMLDDVTVHSIPYEETVNSGGGKTAKIAISTISPTSPSGDINEVVFGDEKLISLVGDTVSANSLLANVTAHDASGSAITGTIPSVTAGTPTATKGAVSNHSVSVTPSVTNTTGYITGGTKTGTAVTVSASELVSGTKSISENGTGIDVANYASVNVSVAAPAPALQNKTRSYTPTETEQTESVSADTGYDGLGTVGITVGAISSTYVGSGITRRSATDLTANGATVTVPAGFYSQSAAKAIPNASFGATSDSVNKTSSSYTYTRSYPGFIAGYLAEHGATSFSLSLDNKTVTPSTSSQTVTPTNEYYYLNSVTVEAMPTGAAGTPTATKGAVSNHSVSVTPSVTNTTGYITGDTKTGTAVTVSASELVSGNLSITENDDNIDVTNYATVSVNVPSGGAGAISIVDTIDEHGGTIRTITAVDITDTTAIASDVAQGKYFFTADGTKTLGTASISTPEVTITTSGAVTQELQPDTIYHFTSDSLTALTVTFAGTGTEQYHFDFISPSTAVVLTLPVSVTMETSFSVEVNTKYEIDIYNNEGVFAEWAVQS